MYIGRFFSGLGSFFSSRQNPAQNPPAASDDRTSLLHSNAPAIPNYGILNNAPPAAAPPHPLMAATGSASSSAPNAGWHWLFPVLDTSLYWLIASRAYAAVLSGFGIQLAITGLCSYGFQAAGEDASEAQKNAIVEYTTITLASLTFAGMLLGSSFAQGTRLLRTIDDKKENLLKGKKESAPSVPPLLTDQERENQRRYEYAKRRLPVLHVLTGLYAGQLGYNTLISSNHILLKFFGTSDPRISYPLGLLFALGYALITYNYNNVATDERLWKIKQGLAAASSASLIQKILFALGNILPQITLNTLFTATGLEDHSRLDVRDRILIAGLISLLTTPGLISAQSESFFSRTAPKAGGILNIARMMVTQNVHLPSHFPLLRRVAFSSMVLLSDWAVLMMIPSSSNSFGTLPALVARDSYTAYAAPLYFGFFGGSLFFTIVNAGNYMAFNTADGQFAFLFFLLTRTLPHVKQMEYIKALSRLQEELQNPVKFREALAKEFVSMKPEWARLNPADKTALIQTLIKKMAISSEFNTFITEQTEALSQAWNFISPATLEKITQLVKKTESDIKAQQKILASPAAISSPGSPAPVKYDPCFAHCILQKFRETYMAPSPAPKTPISEDGKAAETIPLLAVPVQPGTTFSLNQDGESRARIPQSSQQPFWNFPSLISGLPKYGRELDLDLDAENLLNFPYQNAATAPHSGNGTVGRSV